MPSRPQWGPRRDVQAAMEIAGQSPPLPDDQYDDDDDDDDDNNMEGARRFVDHPEEDMADEEEEDDEEEADDEEAHASPHSPQTSSLPPRGLKDISSLASWTVSTSKPGCGVSALRSPDTTLFWQSDGPQPHLLSIHFFKLVSIAHMRLHLDFGADESYTPTKMQFWAGMGVHDLQMWAEMAFEQPRGWIDVDFSGVGPVAGSGDNGDVDGLGQEDVDWDARPVLRAFLVQVRILENHQNGKDTHLRGLQIFARDHMVGATAVPAEVQLPVRNKVQGRRAKGHRIAKASWMLEPELR